MDLCPPPAHADEKETPVLKELRRLSFEGVSDELKNPSDEEQAERIRPKTVEEETGDKKRRREQDGRDAQSVTHPVHRMLMTGRILRDPLLVGASAQHAQDDITISSGRVPEQYFFGQVPRFWVALRFSAAIAACFQNRL
jgi:hypothetical protein